MLTGRRRRLHTRGLQFIDACRIRLQPGCLWDTDNAPPVSPGWNGPDDATHAAVARDTTRQPHRPQYPLSRPV